MLSAWFVWLVVACTAAGQPTDGCKGRTSVSYTAALLEDLLSSSCCARLAEEVHDLRVQVEHLVRTAMRGTQQNPGRSCRDIRESGQTSSAAYWVQPNPDVHPFPVQVFCEMEFLGGGWTRVFNMMAKPQVDSSGLEMHAVISRNADIRVVLSNSTSTAIYTRGLRLQEYTQAVFGWAPSADVSVSHYGVMTRDEGLVGVCYLDRACPERHDIGTFTSSVTGNARTYQTGYSLRDVNVGIGYHAQAIVWGYDRNRMTNPATAGTFYSHWGNWNDTLPTTSGSPCCHSGATQDLLGPDDEWRYSILIR